VPPALHLARRPRLQSRAAALLGALLCGSAVLAARVPASVPDADAVLDEAWEVVRTQPGDGPLLPDTRARAVRLRRLVGAWPTEAKRRVAYAAVLFACARAEPERAAAAFHAALAARLAPATAPVQSSAAVLLAGCGDLEGGVRCVRRLFALSPREGARVLLHLEPVLDPRSVDAALPELPEAHLAWIARLQEEGDRGDADRVLAAAWTRWPEEPRVLRAAVLADRGRGDWAAAASKLEGRSLDPELRAVRARALAETGRTAEARAELLSLEGAAAERVDLLQLCGDAALALPDPQRARALFEAALYRLPPEAPLEHRIRLLRRLATAEERLGHPGAALRLWREVLALDGGDAAAGARVAALTGLR
jgi:tetratricopeptide (TPR) repeat protein